MPFCSHQEVLLIADRIVVNAMERGADVITLETTKNLVGIRERRKCAAAMMLNLDLLPDLQRGAHSRIT